MKYTIIVIAGIFVLACMVMPASAFTMKSLDVTIGQNGDATIDAQYGLSFIEQSAVYFQLADPSRQLQSAFNTKASAQVTVESVSPNSARISIPFYTSVKKGDDGITYTTPALSFERARTALKSYWFAPLVSLDFSKGVTTVTFPDGYQEQFYGQITIPAVSHTVP